MYEHVTEAYRPKPIDTFQGPPGAPTAQWIEHRTRRSRVGQRFGDLQRHPNVGVRQGGFSRGVYANNARMVDEELRKVPYPQRLTAPAGGAYPVIQGVEIGTGPHPWFEATDSKFLPRGPRARQAGYFGEDRRRHPPAGRRAPPGGPSGPSTNPRIDRDDGDRAVGPAARHPGILPPTATSRGTYPTPSPTPGPTPRMVPGPGGSMVRAPPPNPRPVTYDRTAHMRAPATAFNMRDDRGAAFERAARNALGTVGGHLLRTGGATLGAMAGSIAGPSGASMGSNLGGALGSRLASAVFG